MEWLISDDAVVELARKAEATKARGWTLSVYERAFLDLHEARQQLRALELDDLPGDFGPAFPEPEPRCHPDDHFRRECWHYEEAN